MKLIHTIHTLVEQETHPFWVKEALNSWDWDDIKDTVKLFGGDLHEYYLALEKKGVGEQFLSQVQNWDDDPRFYIMLALGGRDKIKRGMVDTDLLTHYIIKDMVEELNSDIEMKEGKIYLTLDRIEKPYFFDINNTGYDRHSSCEEMARLIFNESLGEYWEDYEWTPNIEELIMNLTPKNYELLLTHIITNFQNEDIKCEREEFETWREEDGITNGFFVLPSRFNSFLKSKYELGVLIECSPDLSDYKYGLQNAYTRAFNDGILSNWYKSYHEALEELLGEPVGTTTTFEYRGDKKIELPAEIYDVTDLASKVFIELSMDGEEFQHSDFAENYREWAPNGGLCPDVDEEEPEDEEEVWEMYNDIVMDYL